MKIKEKKELNFECNRCLCEFKFDASDIKIGLFEHYLRCPCCRQKYSLGNMNFKDIINVLDLRDYWR